MSRTLDAALLAAMNTGVFTPWFKVQLIDNDLATVIYETTDVTGFTIDSLSASVSFHSTFPIGSSFATFRILRGINVAGVPNYITSSQFHPRQSQQHNQIRELYGHIFPPMYYSVEADVTYHSLIDTVCAEMHKTVSFEDPAAAWLNYKFYPAGRFLILNDARDFFTILRQKYLIFACDNCDDDLYFCSPGVAAPAETYTLSASYINFDAQMKYRKQLWRDEAHTIHWEGETNSPIHNFGFIESTAAAPARYYWVDDASWIIQNISPHLKYRDFDRAYVSDPSDGMFIWPIKYREIYDRKKTPSWQWHARHLDVYGNTEGGHLPSTIEAAAPYTPLVTGNFDGVLSSTDNNIQSAMETLDDHDHATVYAPTARGVTNGDSHDHSGGDGAQINHTTLANSGSNTHAQIDNHVALARKELLTSTRDYYVRTDGNDSNTGLVNNAGGAFLTIQKGIDQVLTLDLNGCDVYIRVADGTYNITSDLTSRTPNGQGAVHLVGNATTPGNVVIACATGNAGFNNVSHGIIYYIDGFKFTSTTSVYTFLVSESSNTRFSNIEFGTGWTFHIYAFGLASITAYGNYKISAGAWGHVLATCGANFAAGAVTVTISNNPAWGGAFVYALELGMIASSGTTFTGACTGSRYNCTLNATINTFGGGANYFPGNAVGSSATGGQYA